jgi:hypothetical protein
MAGITGIVVCFLLIKGFGVALWGDIGGLIFQHGIFERNFYQWRIWRGIGNRHTVERGADHPQTENSSNE